MVLKRDNPNDPNTKTGDVYDYNSYIMNDLVKVGRLEIDQKILKINISTNLICFLKIELFSSSFFNNCKIIFWLVIKVSKVLNTSLLNL